MSNQVNHEARAEFLEGNDIGVLVIHGFTGSTQSMRLVGYQLNKWGYTVSMPCLKGHGTTPEDMETCTYRDWIDSVKTAYTELAAKVKDIFVFGLSMGGTLTLYCGIHFPVKGIITVNAAVSIPSFKEIYKDPNTPRFIQGIGSDIKKTGVKEWAYDRTPKISIGEIVELTEQVRSDLPKVTCPLLVFKSLEDHVVPPDNQDYIYQHVKSVRKELIVLSESYHVATLDNDLDFLLSKTHEFIERNK